MWVLPRAKRVARAFREALEIDHMLPRIPLRPAKKARKK
jgi:hypothetical protein